MTKKSFLIFIVFFLFSLQTLLGQESTRYNNIDKIVAVVGNTILLDSEVKGNLLEMQRQMITNSSQDNDINTCASFNSLVMQKFLLLKAQRENIEIDDAQIDENINQRINFFARQIGSIELLEKEYLGKTIIQFKEDIRPKMRESMLAEKAQSELVSKITVNPSEVETFYKNIANDQMPLIDAVAIVGQIVIYPSYSESDLQVAKNKISNVRERIIAGESFGTLAALYSQDPGSSHNNGELGFFGRGEMTPEFESAAFRLSQPNELSQIIKTPFGYHILQLIARKGQQVNVRHILIKPTYSISQLEIAKSKLTEVLDKIKNNSLTFDQAAVKYSEDELTKQNLGFFIDPETKSTKIKLDKLFQIDNTLTDIVSKLNPGEYSNILPYTDTKSFEHKNGYRFVYLKSYIKPHKMDLHTDYEQIQSMALNDKKTRTLHTWFRNQEKNIYLNIDSQYKDCLKNEKLF